MANITTPYNLTIPLESGGVNKDTAASTQLLNLSGFEKVDDTTYPQLDVRNGPTKIEADDWHISGNNDLDGVFLWCDAGADIENFQGAYHKLADPNKVCPYDPEGLQNWFEFGVVGESHAPQEIPVGSGDWYRSMLIGTQGTPLNCQQWFDYIRAPLTNSTGIADIISLFDFQEIQAANAPTP